MPAKWQTKFVPSNSANASRAVQSNFLRALWQGNLTLPQVLRKSKVSRRRLCYWMMRSTSFRKELNNVRNRLRTLRTFESELLSCVEQVKLAKAIQKGNVKLKVQRPKPRGRRHPGVSNEQSKALRKAMQEANA